jgi:chemotaxis protein methyltransferase WspC
MTLIELENLLKTAIGLDASTIGKTSVERAIKQRMREGGFESLASYWDCVTQSPTELQELIEAVVIPETWFFRDTEAFSALEKVVRDEWLPAHREGVLRLLSVPCASGEEPYSMAMCLHRLGLHSSRVHIDAIDVSREALARARKAIFGRNSFRGSNLDFRNQYFEQIDKGYVLADAIREQVFFERGNLLGEGFAAGRAPYDIIFCRNLLIYFDQATQTRAIATLKQMLTPEGLLFSGPSESGILLNNRFASAGLPRAFAFRKVPETSSSFWNGKSKPPPIMRAQPTLRPVTTPKRATTMSIPGALTSVPQTINLDAAHQLADEGKLAEATEICRACLLQNGPSPQVFYLLGLVQDASGNKEQAREFYRKAVYLQPDHYEALVHLALLSESLGDRVGARLLQERAARVKPTNKP